MSIVSPDMNEYCVPGYPDIDALLSGEGLKNLILGLKTRGFNVNIYAHSQGCMVTSEALRQIALNPDPNYPNPVVDSMTFSQAAVSARMYDGNYPEYDGWNGLFSNLVSPATTALELMQQFTWPFDIDMAAAIKTAIEACPSRPQWPDLHGHFPYHLESPGTVEHYAPYFLPVQQAVAQGKMFNYYNPSDYPTGQYNSLPGLLNRVSGSWLLDQLIKPYRIVSYPRYSDRAYGMVYGLPVIDPSLKALFTRNMFRQDYYCLNRPTSQQCGILMTCQSDPIFDFSIPTTKYEMIAYGCPSYSRSLGGHTSGLHLSASSGFVADSVHDVDLQTVFGYREYVMWHGAQFRGMLADQRPYWVRFLTNIGITPP